MSNPEINRVDSDLHAQTEAVEAPSYDVANGRGAVSDAINIVVNPVAQEFEAINAICSRMQIPRNTYSNDQIHSFFKYVFVELYKRNWFNDVLCAMIEKGKRTAKLIDLGVKGSIEDFLETPSEKRTKFLDQVIASGRKVDLTEFFNNGIASGVGVFPIIPVSVPVDFKG